MLEVAVPCAIAKCFDTMPYPICNALKLEARKLLERERLGASCGSS
jgi:hypothetical protein